MNSRDAICEADLYEWTDEDREPEPVEEKDEDDDDEICSR